MRMGVTAVVSGRVQMVMYRDFTKRKALALGLVGVVENMADGTVSVYAEGEEEALQKFMELLKKGTLLSSVENVAYKFGHPKGGYTTFSIHYT